MNYKALNDAEILKDKKRKAAQKISKSSAMYNNSSKFEYKGKSEKIQKNIDQALNLVSMAQIENQKTEKLLNEDLAVN